MKTKKILQLPWIPLEDWSKLEASHMPIFHSFRHLDAFTVSKLDVELFIISVTEELSIKFNISFDEMDKIIHNKNVSFFQLKDKLFSKYLYFNKDNPKLLNLQQTFMIPYRLKDSKLRYLIELYEKLPAKDKTKFLEYIGNFDIEINVEVVPK